MHNQYKILILILSLKIILFIVTSASIFENLIDFIFSSKNTTLHPHITPDYSVFDIDRYCFFKVLSA